MEIIAVLSLLLVHWFIVYKRPLLIGAWLGISSLLVLSILDVQWCCFALFIAFVNYGFICLRQKKSIAKGWFYILVVFNGFVYLCFKHNQDLIDFLNLLLGTRTNYYLLTHIGLFFFMVNQVSLLKNDDQEDHSFFDFLSFSFFLPKVFAGPFINLSEWKEKLELIKNEKFNPTVLNGILLIIKGLFLKIVFANSFQTWADNGFSATVLSLNIVQAWVVSLSNCFYYFFDISAYFLIVLGISQLFGFRFKGEMNYPLKALTLADFWNRWMVSFVQELKKWFVLQNDTPNKNKGKTMLKLVFLFSMLFVSFDWKLPLFIWVFWNVFGIGFTFLVQKLIGQKTRWSKLVLWFITFQFIHISWVLFRAETLENVKIIIGGLINLPNLIQYYNEFFILWAINASYVTFIFFTLAAIYVYTEKPMTGIYSLNKKQIWTYGLMLAIILLLFNLNPFMLYEFR